MKLLISPRSLDEISTLVDSAVDIVDLKSTDEGALGAPSLNFARDALARLREVAVHSSLSLGDLPDSPGTAALAALGAATLDVDDIKIGLFGSASFERARLVLQAVNHAICQSSVTRRNAEHNSPRLIAACYADYRKFGGLHPSDLVRAAAESGCAGVMVDTLHKDGSTLFDALSTNELGQFIADARSASLEVGLAGSIGEPHRAALEQLAPDFVGVRGCVCYGGDRNRAIDPARVQSWLRGRSSPVKPSERSVRP